MPVETLSDTLMGRCVTPVGEDHGDKYGVLSLEELGEFTDTHLQYINVYQPKRIIFMKLYNRMYKPGHVCGCIVSVCRLISLLLT